MFADVRRDMPNIGKHAPEAGSTYAHAAQTAQYGSPYAVGTAAATAKGNREVLNDLMTTEQLAERLHLTRQAVYMMNHAGTGPRSVRVGRRRLYPREAVEQWLRDRLDAQSR